MTEDEMVGQCHRSNQYEFDQTLGGSGRQEGLACSGPWGHKESDMTERLNERMDVMQICIVPSEIFDKVEEKSFRYTFTKTPNRLHI